MSGGCPSPFSPFPPPWNSVWAQVLIGAVSSALPGSRSGQLSERNRIVVSKSPPSDPLRARLQFPQIAPDLLYVL